MKKISKVSLVAIGMLFMVNFAKAQLKTGYINYQVLFNLMPETKTIKEQLGILSQQFTDQLETMQKEIQAKENELQAQSATITDAVKTAKIAELQVMQNRIEAYNDTARQKFDAKVSELRKPVDDKVHAAIASVAKEKGYTYVFDSSQTPLVVKPDADDLLDAVKAKLGIK